MSVKSQTEAQSDFCVRRILHRVKLTDRHLCLLAIICHDFIWSAVKISYDIIRFDTMFIEKHKSSVHADDKFSLFTFQNREDEIFFQHSAAHDHCTLTHIFSKSP